MKKYDKTALVLLSIINLILLLGSISSLYFYPHLTGKLFSTLGLLLTIMGLIQIEVSGFFDKLLKSHLDTSKPSFDPPSYIAREIVWNPDTPIRSTLKSYLFFTPITGFWIIILGTIIQIIGIWS